MVQLASSNIDEKHFIANGRLRPDAKQIDNTALLPRVTAPTTP
jgi:hypothetical protein